MPRWTWISWGWLGACAVAQAGVGSIPEGARLVTPAAVAVSAPQVARDIAVPAAALRRGDAAGALAALAAVQDDARFETAAVTLIEQVQREAPSAAAEAFLAALAAEPVRLYRRHEETAGEWYVPLYDVPGRAASARELLARVGERDRLLPRLKAGEVEALSSKRSAAVVAAAIEALTPAEAQRLSSRAASRGASLAAGAWAALAQRSPDARSLAAVIEREQPADAVRLLQQPPAGLEPQAALAWLELALARPEYRSTAVAALGREAVRSPAALQKLESLLHDADAVTGASAAAALVQLPESLKQTQFDRLAKSSDPVVLSRVALALRLDGSPEALERLQRLSEDPRLPAHVRKELQR